MQRLLQTLREQPENASVALSAGELLGGGSWNQQLTIDAGRRFVTDAVVHCNAMSDGFFATLGVSMLGGRDFNARDGRRHPTAI